MPATDIDRLRARVQRRSSPSCGRCRPRPRGRARARARARRADTAAHALGSRPRALRGAVSLLVLAPGVRCWPSSSRRRDPRRRQLGLAARSSSSPVRAPSRAEPRGIAVRPGTPPGERLRSLPGPNPGRYQDYEAWMTLRVQDLDALSDQTNEAMRSSARTAATSRRCEESTRRRRGPGGSRSARPGRAGRGGACPAERSSALSSSGSSRSVTSSRSSRSSGPDPPAQGVHRARDRGAEERPAGRRAAPAAAAVAEAKRNLARTTARTRRRCARRASPESRSRSRRRRPRAARRRAGMSRLRARRARCRLVPGRSRGGVLFLLIVLSPLLVLAVAAFGGRAHTAAGKSAACSPRRRIRAVPLALSTGHRSGSGSRLAPSSPSRSRRRSCFRASGPNYPRPRAAGVHRRLLRLLLRDADGRRGVRRRGAGGRGSRRPRRRRGADDDRARRRSRRRRRRAADDDRALRPRRRRRSPGATVDGRSRPSSRSRSRRRTLKAGKITFEVKNDGKIPHDLAIKGASRQDEGDPDAGGSAKLTVTLKPGTYELYCTVPGPRSGRHGARGHGQLAVPCASRRRGGRAVECGGLENRFGLLGRIEGSNPSPSADPRRFSWRRRHRLLLAFGRSLFRVRVPVKRSPRLQPERPEPVGDSSRCRQARLI